MYKIIGSDQREYGPITAEQMRQWIAEGRVGAQTMVQSDTDPNWRPLSSFVEFAASFATAPPGIAAQFAGTDTRAQALSMVKGPAIFMLVVAPLGILLGLLAVVVNLAGGNQSRFQSQDPEIARMATAMQGPIALVFCAFTVLIALFIIFGALKMMKLQSYGLCIATCIVVMLPCVGHPCCCLLGLPAGIWGLVVLNNPVVKSNFS